MGNFDTIQSITVNLQTVLSALGLKFSTEIIEDLTSVPLSALPLGQIFYTGENFEYTYNERPKYADAEFTLKIVFNSRDAEDATRESQRWSHNIRDGITVIAINTGGLSGSKLVSRIDINTAEVQTTASNLTVLNCRMSIRYREV